MQARDKAAAGKLRPGCLDSTLSLDFGYKLVRLTGREANTGPLASCALKLC